ncbi:MAG: hypothetical protein GC159_03160 [Phycisphaera sp.]|nr:hypothetical protein [Phycisphaera sp.]
MSQRLNIAVIGGRFGAQVHVPAWRSVGRCDVVALGASTEASARAAAEAAGVPRAAGDWRAIVVDETVDVVSVAVPPIEQPAIVRAALEHGKAVFCEKPLAVSVDDAAQLAALATRRGLANVINFEFTVIPAWGRMRTMLAARDLGAPRWARVVWRVRTYANEQRLSDSWKTRPGQGGGTLSNLAAHTLHYVEWMLGPIARLTARLEKRGDDDRDTDTRVTMRLHLVSGCEVDIEVDADSTDRRVHMMSVECERGTLQLRNDTGDYISGFRVLRGAGAGGALETVLADDAFVSASGDGRVAATAVLVRRVADWLQSGTPARPNFADGLRVQRLIDAARRADATGEPTPTPQPDTT